MRTALTRITRLIPRMRNRLSRNQIDGPVNDLPRQDLIKQKTVGQREMLALTHRHAY